MGTYAILKEEKKEFQCTVSNILYFKGIGLHTGKESSVIVKPAKADSGITFIRKDLNPCVIIKAKADNVCSTILRTSIGLKKNLSGVGNEERIDASKAGNITDGGVLGCISTVEHLMSALWGAGIDNALIEVYGDEIPAMDGSARAFYESFFESGIKELNAKRKYIEILKPIAAESEAEKGVSLEIYPSEDFEIFYDMDFSHPLLKSGSFDMKIDGFNFYKEISKARTFGFLKDVEYLKKNGLALGGSLDNALVLDETSVLNKDGLRYKDEFIRHKVLDLIGDLYLSGYRIKGRVLAKKTGHDMNSKMVKKIGEYLNPAGILTDNKKEDNGFLTVGVGKTGTVFA